MGKTTKGGRVRTKIKASVKSGEKKTIHQLMGRFLKSAKGRLKK